MNNPMTLVLTALAGSALGALYFGGLWWTVRRSLASTRPALWMLISGVVRLGVALTGFYLLGGGHWETMLACLVGFMVGRAVVTRLTRLPSEVTPLEPRQAVPQESPHAP